MNIFRRAFVLSGLIAALLATAYTQDELPVSFACSASNDLYRVLTSHGERYKRYDSAVEAFAHAPEGSGVMVLADGYPWQTTPLDGTLAYAAKRRLKVYVEYPEALQDLELES